MLDGTKELGQSMKRVTTDERAEGLRKEVHGVFFPDHCSPSPACRRATYPRKSVQSLLLADHFLYNHYEPQCKTLQILGKNTIFNEHPVYVE